MLKKRTERPGGILRPFWVLVTHISMSSNYNQSFYSGPGYPPNNNTSIDYSDIDDGPIETRSIKQTTATKFLQKDDSGEFKLNPDIYIDKENWHGVYSYNQGQFPFVLRPYKYMVLRTKRDASADEILLELKQPSKWGLDFQNQIDEANSINLNH